MTGSRRFGVTIERRSSQEQVANALREAIFNGVLLPGTPLREASLSEELGVSRNTIREACRVLAAEGLVRYEMNRGVEVIELTDTDIDQLYHAREVLEGAGVAALLAFPAVQAEAVYQRLAALVQRLEQTDDVNDALDADRLFHATLAVAAGNPRLTHMHAAIQQELRLALTLAERSTAELGRSGDDHFRLLEAITSGERRKALNALHDHLGAGAAELHRLRTLVARRRQS